MFVKCEEENVTVKRDRASRMEDKYPEYNVITGREERK